MKTTSYLDIIKYVIILCCIIAFGLIIYYIIEVVYINNIIDNDIDKIDNTGLIDYENINTDLVIPVIPTKDYIEDINDTKDEVEELEEEIEDTEQEINDIINAILGLEDKIE